MPEKMSRKKRCVNLSSPSPFESTGSVEAFCSSVRGLRVSGSLA